MGIEDQFAIDGQSILASSGFQNGARGSKVE
jgi:hypothetical protein